MFKSQYQPGTAQLKAHYMKTGLGLLGISFEKAMAVDSIRTAITCKARRAYFESLKKHGKPAPVQAGLFGGESCSQG